METKRHSRPGRRGHLTRQNASLRATAPVRPAPAGPRGERHTPSPAVPGAGSRLSPWPPGSGAARYGIWRQIIQR